MVFQEPGQREAETPLGKAARAAMAGRATVREELFDRFAGVEVLRRGGRRRQRGDHNSHKGRDDFAPRSN